LKKQFSLTPNTNQATIATTRPPQKRQATIFNYESTQLTEYPPLDTKATNLSSNTTAMATTAAPTATATPDCTTALLELKNEISMFKTSMKPSNTTPATVNYAAELVALKQDLQSLHTFITTAVEQLKTENASLHAAPALGDMKTNNAAIEQSTEIPELIAELKHDIATITMEMRAKFNQLATQKSTKHQKALP